MLTIILASISTLLIVICAVLIAIGWFFIRKGQIQTHRKYMVSACVFALAFFIIYSIRTVFIGNVMYGGPEWLKLPYHLFLFFHIILATLGAILGLVSLYLGYKRRFAVHRKISPVTSVIWFGTGITGVAVYFILFILFPGTMDQSLFRSVFGA